MPVRKFVRFKHRLVFVAFTATALFGGWVTPTASAAETLSASNTLLVQSSIANTLDYSKRPNQEYVNNRGKGQRSSGSRSGKGRSGKPNRGVIKTRAVFAGFGGGYVGLDGTSLMIDNAADNDLNPRGMRLRLGMRIDQVFDLEVHLGGGSDSATPAADKFSATYFGGFLKGYLPVGGRSAVYGLAGFSAVDVNQRFADSEFSDSRTGFSYGFGLETELSERLDLSADFVRYVGDEGEFSAVSTVNLGIKLYF